VTKRKSIRRSVEKVLWWSSRGMCAFPGCRKELVVEATPADPAKPIGKVAHIVASSDKGPRGDPNYPSELKDEEDNLILLCPDHHDRVDGQPNTYTCDDLRKWKRDHAKWAKRRLREEMVEVGFKDFEELELVRKALLVAPYVERGTFNVVPPAEKMKRNGFGPQVQSEVTLALIKAKEVGKFVEYMSQQDMDFPERLRRGFVEEYLKQRDSGLEGDALFVALREFAGGYSSDFGDQAAGLAVLVYLFEKCEVFES